jgi:hypothetical protein
LAIASDRLARTVSQSPFEAKRAVDSHGSCSHHLDPRQRARAKETAMKSVGCGVSLSLALCAGAPLAAQVQPSDAPSRTQVVAAAKAIMQEARYCTFVTAGRDGQPQARIVDPFPPDSDFVVWIATNALTRKVEEIRRNPRVTLP